MAKVTKPCRVCGTIFTPCVDCVSDNSAFHWREVACSKECGNEYLRQVLEAREVHPIKTVENVSIEEDEIVEEKISTVSTKKKSITISE